VEGSLFEKKEIPPLVSTLGRNDNKVPILNTIIMWEPLGDLIPSSVKKSGIEKSVSDAMVCEEFQFIAKNILKDASEHCHAVYIKDGCLWIAVLSNSVSNELKMYEQDILKAFDEKFGEERVTSFKFMV